MAEKLRAVVVGLNMGKTHARTVSVSDRFELAAVCDLKADLLAKAAEDLGCAKAYADYGEMLAKERPDVVVVASHHSAHRGMVMEACAAGVRGIYCEKPISVSMREAKEMLAECGRRGVRMVVGHQRRMTGAYRAMRRAIEDGVIGDVHMVRASCPGDMLSDGSHALNSMLYLSGDRGVEWLEGHVTRDDFPINEEKEGPGYRQGHLIEQGAMAVMEFEGGMRGELFTGRCRVNGWNLPYPGWAYQDIEVFGTKGRLWRCGDSSEPPVRVYDHEGGVSALPMSGRPSGKGPEVDPPHGARRNDMVVVFDGFADMILEGAPHEMDGEKGMRTLELVTAVFESSRLGRRMTFPLGQDEYPLELMVADRLKA